MTGNLLCSFTGNHSRPQNTLQASISIKLLLLDTNGSSNDGETEAPREFSILLKCGRNEALPIFSKLRIIVQIINLCPQWFHIWHFTFYKLIRLVYSIQEGVFVS